MTSSCWQLFVFSLILEVLSVVSSRFSVSVIFRNESTQESANSVKSLHCRSVVTDYMWYKMLYMIRPLQWHYIVKKIVSASVEDSEKLLLHPHPDLDQHPKLNSSRGLRLAHAYRVWCLTSVTALVSYPAHGHTDRLNYHVTLPALAEF